RHFFRLAAVLIRRELLDLSRHYYGPLGPGAHHASRGPEESTNRSPAENAPAHTFDPVRLGGWEDFHRQVGELPDDEREVFELLWYHELSQGEAAELLEVSRRTVIRRWQSACLHLHDAMQGEMP
ncbi:MAG: sigma factor-like helix-turn-helix DNA-binding protein, partial [Planctomycetaceae bacterium]